MKVTDSEEGYKAPFTRYRFHFISDWVRQSDMKIPPVYTMPFSFHSGLGFCLHDTVSPCTVMVSPYSVMVPLRILRSPLMDSRLVELIMRFRTELISDSTVYTISDWFHATFRAFSFENAKTV